MADPTYAVRSWAGAPLYTCLFVQEGATMPHGWDTTSLPHMEAHLLEAHDLEAVEDDERGPEAGVVEEEAMESDAAVEATAEEE